MERFIQEVKRGTKVRNHKFLGPGAICKLVYLESERQKEKGVKRRLKGFGEAWEILEKVLLKCYAPIHKLLDTTHIPLFPRSFPWMEHASFLLVPLNFCPYAQHFLSL